MDALGGAKPKRLVANHGAAPGQIVVPAKKIRDAVPAWNIGAVEGIVAVVNGRQNSASGPAET